MWLPLVSLSAVWWPEPGFLSACCGEQFGSCQQRERITQRDRRGLRYSDAQQLLSIKIAAEREETWMGRLRGRQEGWGRRQGQALLQERNTKGTCRRLGYPRRGCCCSGADRRSPTGPGRQPRGRGKGWTLCWVQEVFTCFQFGPHFVTTHLIPACYPKQIESGP